MSYADILQMVKSDLELTDSGDSVSYLKRT